MKPDKKILSKISNFLSDKVVFAYLFGSVNTKYFTQNSDIDIAVWIDSKTIKQEYIQDLKLQIEKNINFAYEIDLVILNNADFIISKQIADTGKIIVNNDNKMFYDFILRTDCDYFDFKIWRKPLEENLIKKVL